MGKYNSWQRGEGGEMKQSDFNKLKIGDIIETKNRKGIVIGLGYTLAEVQYIDTKRRVWKSARQLNRKEVP